jgi:hypothetical protein
MGVRAASALGGLVLTTIAQLERSLDDVPHVEVPAIVPATAVTVVEKVPVALDEAVLTVLVSQSVSFVAAPSLMHSRAYRVSLATNPVPVTAMAVPFSTPVLGVAVIVGPAAEAVATPKEVRPPRISVPIAILVISRLIVYVLPIAVVTISH